MTGPSALPFLVRHPTRHGLVPGRGKIVCFMLESFN
jgi:hypothetical protein